MKRSDGRLPEGLWGLDLGRFSGVGGFLDVPKMKESTYVRKGGGVASYQIEFLTERGVLVWGAGV